MLKVTKNVLKIWWFQFFYLPLQCLRDKKRTKCITTKNYKIMKLSFIDGNKNKVELEIEDRNGVLSICGNVCGCYGQCNKHIFPATDTQRRLIDFWDKYHLTSDYPNNELMEIVNKIQQEKLVDFDKKIDDMTEKYGFVLDLDENEKETDLVDKITTILDEQQPDADIVQEDGRRVLALLRATDSSIVDLSGVKVLDNEKIELWGTSYYVGTKDVIEDCVKKFFDKDLWIDAVQNDTTELGFDDWVEEILEDTENWSCLNSFDGRVLEEDIEDDWYYVIREF